MDVDFVRKRITQLRLEKGVSEYQMSLDMGHSRSYIQSIVSGRSLPSMSEFLYMCDYLGVTPSEFFDEHSENPALLQKAVDEMRSLSDKDILSLLSLIERFKEK
jgi:transcriptional regulator with XRE-family HTH domain